MTTTIAAKVITVLLLLLCRLRDLMMPIEPIVPALADPNSSPTLSNLMAECTCELVEGSIARRLGYTTFR